jgi:hypothetical protein
MPMASGAVVRRPPDKESQWSNQTRCSVVTCVGFILFFALGLNFLVISLAYGHTYNGTLTEAFAKYGGGGHGGDHWNVVEGFQKGDSNEICKVYRPLNYDSESRANAAANRTILGSQRQIWEYWDDSNQCYDQTIRDYNFRTGISLLSVAVVWTCLAFLFKYLVSEPDPPVVVTQQTGKAPQFSYMDIERSEIQISRL